MRRNTGTGSITYDKTAKRIVARILVCGKYKKKTFPKNQMVAAEKWLNEMQSHKTSLIDVSVGEWLVEFINNYKKPFVRPRSLERIKQAAYKLSPVYNFYIKDLTPNDIQILINDLKEKGLSASSIKKSHDLLKAALQQAVAEKIITSNPAIAVKRPQMPKKPQIEIFSPKELGKIFLSICKLQNNKYNNSQRYDYNLIFRMLLTTGVRVSELLALTWENVDKNNDLIIIAGSKDIDKQKINAPKTEAGFRPVPLLSAKTKSTLYKNYKKHGFVFQNKNGGAVNYQRIFLTWDKIRKMTGINKTIHAFRHTCVSYLLASGKFSIAEVAQIVGHSSPAITLQIYTHVIRKNQLKSGTFAGHFPKN